MGAQPLQQIVQQLRSVKSTASGRAEAGGVGLLERWHLLSLDAPTVAALWTWFLASANHVRLPWSSIVSMALAVWMLYAADRLMDARLLDLLAEHRSLEARHYFHHRHRTAFLRTIAVGLIALAALLPRLDTEALRLYVVLGVLVCGYFLVIHATRSSHRLPKEIAVGFFFAAATFIPTVARRPDLRLLLLPYALLFAILCSLNCLFIYAWEHGEPDADDPAHAITAVAVCHLPLLAIALTVASAAMSLLGHRALWPISCALAVSAAVLLLLHIRRREIAPITLRAAADLALTTPLLLVFVVHGS